MISVFILVLLGSYVAVADIEDAKKIGFFTILAIYTALRLLSAIV